MATSNSAIETQKISIDPALLKKSVIGDYHRIDLWEDVSELDWEDWHWQVKNRIHTKDEISHIIKITPEEEEGIKKSHGRLSTAVTPYWAALMDSEDPNCPIRKQAIPTKMELNISPHEMTDPCAEDRDSPVKGLVHRYPDRVLLLVTEMCFSYCRHCTRRRMVGENKNILDLKNIDKAIDYIRSDRKIRDVLISGGDPLMLEDDELEEIVKKLSALNQIEFLRIGTRAPVTLPQ
ncbi:MAG: KamA family radical SAM protein, partial [Candidatus Omnitrophica bacterium]|nr:KamA family radical SAM protein [Candidatus Omnitrophota bacterium]